LLDAKTLREVLSYDPETGVFAWKIRKKGIRHGREPGCITKFGHRLIRLDRVAYMAHRLAWLYVYGKWPSNDHIDHINGRPDDNRICNLRDVSVAQNIANRKGPNKNSKSGALGVHRYGIRWCARIMKDRRSIRIGVFDTIADASACVQAYKAAALKEA
jgi:hypothetical protein